MHVRSDSRLPEKFRFAIAGTRSHISSFIKCSAFTALTTRQLASRTAARSPATSAPLPYSFGSTMCSTSAFSSALRPLMLLYSVRRSRISATSSGRLAAIGPVASFSEETIAKKERERLVLRPPVRVLDLVCRERERVVRFQPDELSSLLEERPVRLDVDSKRAALAAIEDEEVRLRARRALVLKVKLLPLHHRLVATLELLLGDLADDQPGDPVPLARGWRTDLVSNSDRREDAVEASPRRRCFRRFDQRDGALRRRQPL